MHREKEREGGGEREIERERYRFPTLQPIHLHEQANMSLLLPSCLSYLVERKKRKKKDTVLGNQGVPKFGEHTEAVNYLVQL